MAKGEKVLRGENVQATQRGREYFMAKGERTKGESLSKGER
ncbi:hypothetical protein GCM10010392_69090 [Streptomyces clavifer]|nr:hypothetical protein GCM10010392_69090 [Streptomyces clavifer]